ncbi:hypothetical protein PV726_41755 [Streptomyces europaeiscabiei]|uniref:hypothetical protein n=1 Tax=Streptomyces europaeiscabiei TaxID=146819 RepID=UPI0029A540B5|nr:hypothetical protein [Streptomyces europaeiscabiei]MDX3696677.1 hypothetical protein [Streptomyces europaeiscabiei]
MPTPSVLIQAPYVYVPRSTGIFTEVLWPTVPAPGIVTFAEALPVRCTVVSREAVPLPDQVEDVQPVMPNSNGESVRRTEDRLVEQRFQVVSQRQHDQAGPAAGGSSLGGGRGGRGGRGRGGGRGVGGQGGAALPQPTRRRGAGGHLEKGSALKGFGHGGTFLSEWSKRIPR